MSQSPPRTAAAALAAAGLLLVAFDGSAATGPRILQKSTPGEIEAGIHSQAMEPRVEPVRVAETREVAPGSDERLLDRIARELWVPEDESGGRVQPRDGQVDEHGEGVMIASPGPDDETSLVHVPPPSAARPWWRAH